MSEVFAAGSWRSLTRAELYIGGKWRTVTRAEYWNGSAWKQVASFVPPLSVSVSPVTVNGGAISARPINVASGIATATPAGGKAPFSYAWTLDSGTASIESPSSASTRFSQTVYPGETQHSVARVTATDALGSTATATVSVNLSNGG